MRIYTIRLSHCWISVIVCSLGCLMRLLLASLILILLLNNHIVVALKTTGLLSVSRGIFVIAALFTFVGLSWPIDHIWSSALQAISELRGVHTGCTLRLPIDLLIIQVAQTMWWLMALGLIDIGVLYQHATLCILPSGLGVILIIYLLSAVNIYISWLLKSIRVLGDL